MDLGFILFDPPSKKYSKQDYWGQTIFVPKTRKKSSSDSSLSSLLNCYQSGPTSESHLIVDISLLDMKAVEIHSETSSSTFYHQDQEIEKYIPCLYLNSMVGSQYLLLYFHASGEDILQSKKLLSFLRNICQINVLAMEYPGYSIYKGSKDSQTIREDALHIYDFVTKTLGFQEKNIVVIGRSIGTGVALELMQRAKPGALALITPFTSIKSLARDYASFLSSLVKESYDNRLHIMNVQCPTFFLHGTNDTIIPMKHTQQLAQLCHQPKQVIIVPNMTHSSFDYYTELFEPLREFLMSYNFALYNSYNGPTVPDHYFEVPANFS